MIYLVLFAGAMALCFPYRRATLYGTRNQYLMGYYALAMVALWVFMGFRGLNVGSDTETYYYHYLQMCNVNGLVGVVERYRTDVGFYILMYFCTRIFKSYVVFQCICSGIYVWSVFALIIKRSLSPLYSVFLFITLGLYTFGMSSVRQSLAISLTVLAYLYLDQNKAISVMFFLGAISFHYTAIVFLPVLFVDALAIKKQSIIVMAIINIAVFRFSGCLQGVFTFISGIFSPDKYYPTQAVGGKGMVAFLLMVFSLTSMIYLRELSEHSACPNKEEKRELMASYFASLVFCMTRWNTVVMRGYYYFFILLIVVIPNMLSRMNNRKQRVFVGGAILLISVYFCIFKVFNDAYSYTRKLLPYQFCWN